MTGIVGSEPIVGRHDPRQLVARLAAAVMIADGRVSATEAAAVQRLEELGFGPLRPLVQSEIERATHQPIDLAATVSEFGDVAPEFAALIVSGLAHIATSDHDLADRELDVLTFIADGLGLDDADSAQIIRAEASAIEARRRSGAGATPCAGAHPSVPPTATTATALPAAAPNDADRAAARPDVNWAFRVLGLAPTDSAEQADAAYAALVRRFNPASVLELGPGVRRSGDEEAEHGDGRVRGGAPGPGDIMSAAVPHI